MAGPEMKASILKDLVAVANLDIKYMQNPDCLSNVSNLKSDLDIGLNSITLNV